MRVLGVLLIAGIAMFMWFGGPQSLTTRNGALMVTSTSMSKVDEDATRKAQIKKDCEPVIDGLIGEYKELVVKRKFWDATVVLRPCAVAMDDQTLIGMVADAELKSYVADLKNPKTRPADRVVAIENMQIAFPEQAKKYAGELPKLRELLAAQSKASAAIEAMRHGVSLGMTRDQAKASSWGWPLDINRTTNASGVLEQWVYGKGRYLYFQDGLLFSIQD